MHRKGIAFMGGLVVMASLAGCATSAKVAPAAGHSETTAEQISAAKKVMGAMGGGRDISDSDLKRLARDMRTNQESQSAVQKIIGGTGAPVIKYSPVTGKHYSGDLEFDPETGAKLEVIKD